MNTEAALALREAVRKQQETEEKLQSLDTFHLIKELRKRMADILYKDKPDMTLQLLLDITSDNDYIMRRTEKDFRIMMRRYKSELTKRVRNI